MLRACILDMEDSWERYLPLVEFAYNNSYQATIKAAPFEALYGRKCRSPLYWDEVGEKKVLGPEIVEKTVEVVKRIRERIKVARDRQKSYADKRRKDLRFSVGEKVFFEDLANERNHSFWQERELRPWFVGPFEILERVGALAYRLALPPDFAAVHNVFHVSML